MKNSAFRYVFLGLAFAAGVLHAGSLEEAKDGSGSVFGESAGSSASAPPARLGITDKVRPLVARLYRPRREPIIVKEPPNHRLCFPDNKDAKIATWIAVILPATAITVLAATSALGLSPISFAVPGAIGAGLTIIGLIRADMFRPSWKAIAVAAALGFFLPAIPVLFWGAGLWDGAVSWIHRLRHR